MPKKRSAVERERRTKKSKPQVRAEVSHSSDKDEDSVSNVASDDHDDDIIEVPLMMDDWLLNQIENDAKHNKKRNLKKYDAKDVCIIGLERIVAVIDSEAFEELPLSVLDSQLQLVTMYQQKFYEQCINSSRSNTAIEMQQKQEDMSKVDKMVHWLQKHILDRKKHIMVDESLAREQLQGAAHNSTGIQSQHVQDVRVKKVEIPKFSGVLRQWPAFKSSFEDCFHKNAAMSNSTKFYHLMAHLEEGSEAFNTIAGMDRTDANYDVAWAALCEAYNNERAIVDDIIKHFIDMPSITTPSRSAFVEVINTTNLLLNSLPRYKVQVEHWDPIMVPLIVRKLDDASRREWAVKRDQRAIPKIKPLLDFLRQRADAIDAVSVDAFSSGYKYSYQLQQNGSYQSKPVSSNGHFRGANGNQYLNASSSQSNLNDKYVHDPSKVKLRIVRCHHCNGLHKIFDCKEFLNMNQELKRGRLESIGVCVKCLRKGHTFDRCRKMRNCVCGEPHNDLVCPKSKPAASILSVVQGEPPDQIDASLIGTLRVYVVDPSGNKVKVRAMSDGGAHMTMVSSRLVQRLKLKHNKLSIPLQGAGKCDITSKTFVDLKILPADNGTSDGECVRAGVLSSISDKLPPNEFDTSDWHHLQGLPLADTTFNVPSDIDVLLSVEFMGRIQLEGFRKDVEHVDRPIAINTTFGWVVYGALPSRLKAEIAMLSHLSVSDSQRLAQNLEKLWQVDNVIEKQLLTPEEAMCKKIFDETVCRAPDGRYIVTMPIMNDPPKLGDSLRAAMARQLTNERRFIKDSSLKEKYVKDIQQFIDMDHMELVPSDEIEKSDGMVYYIPHHAANSSKFRVVFDGSVKTSTGVSLNDILLNGPRVQEDLSVIIMRFRKFAVALTTDVTKMYRQVMIPEHQRDLLRIVWRVNKCDRMKHYRMKRQTYGLKSSAYCCVEALRRCALDYKEQFPLASEAVLNSFYVDDGTMGGNSDVEAEELYRQLNLMLLKGGFPLAKWASNSVHMQSIIGVTAKSVDLDLFNENSVLGIKWSVRDDCFKYDLCEEIQNQSPTKRFIISSVARLFDPNGWISPIVILGKVLIQDIWRVNCDWDDVVPLEIQQRWNEYRAKLVHLSEIKIPRWLGIRPSAKVQLHGFADASLKSYGVCFYVRVEDGDMTQCNLVISKTRVAPVKGMTVPRLELCAAVMMAQMCKQVIDTHDLSISDVALWVDSSIVIHWLAKCPAGMKTFVANRVAEAQELTKGAIWKHVRTEDNPADLASRGVNADELVENSMWFHGPNWLCKPSSEWPNSDFVADQRLDEVIASEMKPRQVFAVTKREILPRIESPRHAEGELLIDCYSTMTRLVRVTAWVMRFIDAVAVKRERRRYDSLWIGKMEYLRAQTIWIRHHQEQSFGSELNILRESETPVNLSKESPLLKITPFIDGDGLMRVGGRIKRSLMPFDTKHPIVLHGDSKFARLLAIEAHASTLHGGTQQCLQYIRQRFWVLNLRTVVKRVASKCVKCFRQRKEMAEQLMGDLPSSRVVAGHAFESVGVDYFGPVTVKERTGRTKKTFKAWVALFICMKSKGVYLDLVTDLTTDAFLACLTRLHSVRGKIQEIWSDNATTFHGAANELKAIHEHWVKLSKDPALDPIKWNFIAPMSPSQGGLWERMVRSSKHHLRRVIGSQTLTYEEYDTLLANVSACLNSRPLIVLDDDATSVQALTPAHLIMGRPLVGPIQYDYTDIPNNRLKRWHLLQKMLQEYWNAWQQEYVVHLIERTKWKRERENIRIGAVVLIKMENMPPTHWPLGRIVNVFAGDDGRIRNVEVQIGSTTYRRCVNKVAILPIDDDEESESN